jgi:hypothetical protein
MINQVKPSPEGRCGGSGLVSITGQAVPGYGTIGVPESAPCLGCQDCQEAIDDALEREKPADESEV